MSLSTEETLKFIEDYKNYPALWDVSSKLYTNKTVRNEALAILGETYNLDIQGVKNKIKSLRSYFSKEDQKVTRKSTGSGADDVYESQWFGYKPLLFVKDSMTVRETRETEDSFVEKETESNDFIDIPPSVKVECLLQGTSSETPPQTQPNHHFPRALNYKRKFAKETEETTEHEAYHLMTAAQLNLKDEAAIFGQLVSAKLRKLSPRNQAVAENQIQNFLFQLEMQEMGAPQPSPPQAQGFLQSSATTPYSASP